MDQTAQDAVFQVGVTVHKTRHDGCLAKISHLLLGIARLHTLGTAYFNDAPVTHQHGAIVDYRRGDGDDMCSTD